MNTLLLGLLCGMALFLCFVLSFYLGFKHGQKLRGTNIPQPTEEQIRKAKEMQEGWQNILNYDVNIAMGRGQK